MLVRRLFCLVVVSGADRFGGPFSSAANEQFLGWEQSMMMGASHAVIALTTPPAAALYRRTDELAILSRCGIVGLDCLVSLRFMNGREMDDLSLAALLHSSGPCLFAFGTSPAN